MSADTPYSAKEFTFRPRAATSVPAAPSTERFLILGGEAISPWVCADEPFKLDRFNAIKWIAGGEFKGVSKIVAFDLANGTCRDATEELARDVMTRWAHEGEPLADWQYDFVEQHVGVNAARTFAREVA